MMTRLSPAWIGLAITLLLTPGCDSEKSCSPSSCPAGCCHPQFGCVQAAAQNSASGCGSQGMVCQACSGQCVAGVCSTGPTGCTAAECAAQGLCCHGQAGCIAASDPRCGACQSGTCTGSPAGCTAAECAAQSLCCHSQLGCIPPIDARCGTCQNGACSGAPSCGPGTCQGCCDAMGYCVEAASQGSSTGCGLNGASCLPCLGGTCQQGLCQPGCTVSCLGCCYNGACLPYGQQTSGTGCGTLGIACQPCPTGYCFMGECKVSTACGAIPEHGCCVAGTETLKWCDMKYSQSLQSIPCGDNGDKCGWDPDNNRYDCGASDAADPGGTPKACP